MDQWQEIREIWGDVLVPIPQDLITAPVTELTRRALTELGLPVADPLTSDFYRDHRLLGRVVARGHDYLLVGDDEGVPIGIAADSDAMYFLYRADVAEIRFINSALVDFLYCYGLFRRELPVLRATTDQAARVIVRRLRRLIASRDPAAMAGGRGTWPSLLGAAERGEV